MPEWSLVGPKIPVPVWGSHLLRATGLHNVADGVQWERVSLGGATWRRMKGGSATGRTLLLVHGTGMRTRSGFMGFTPEDFSRLRALYGDRILAYEHRALAQRLVDNVRDLCRALVKGGEPLDLDVLGVSRGGLIARYLAEGWATRFLGDQPVRVRKLLFVGTPNCGTPSARRDPRGPGTPRMKAWRVDVRRMALVNKVSRPVEQVDDPFAIDGFVDFEAGGQQAMLRWPGLFGSQDQLPGSAPLRQLNGFDGPPPGGARQDPLPRYYGVASVFNFDHGAPNAVLLPGSDEQRRSDVAHWALPVANDLVVPTSSVYAPRQGPHASGLFPLARERLMVLAPSANASHVGLLRLDAVRDQLLRWLEDDDGGQVGAAGA